MSITVKLRHLRISPRKVRLVADTIRQKGAEEAESQLGFMIKKAARPVKKLLKSAIASAENDFGLEKKNLYISKIHIDEGPTLKRSRPRARGRFFPIMKRTSHITLSLDEIGIEKTEKKIIKKKPGKSPTDIQADKRVEKPASLRKKEMIKKISEEAAKEEKPFPDRASKDKKISKREPIKRPAKEGKALKIKTRKPLLKRVFRRKSF